MALSLPPARRRSRPLNAVIAVFDFLWGLLVGSLLLGFVVVCLGVVPFVAGVAVAFWTQTPGLLLPVAFAVDVVFVVAFLLLSTQR